LAFRFSYKGKTLIFGGDVPAGNWELRRRYESNSKTALSGDVVNLPHHGSRIDCEKAVLVQVFAAAGRRIGVTSANGLSHPDLDVIRWLSSNKIEPYCTNLIPACGANAQQLLTLPGIDPGLARWIREVSANTGQVQTCQGDIVVRIDENGELEVVPEHANHCGFRADDPLFGALS
jgi:hypothetical protein